MEMISLLCMFVLTLLSMSAIVCGENLTDTKCEDGWFDESSVGLGCLFIEKRIRLDFDDAKTFCKNHDYRTLD